MGEYERHYVAENHNFLKKISKVCIYAVAREGLQSIGNVEFLSMTLQYLLWSTVLLQYSIRASHFMYQRRSCCLNKSGCLDPTKTYTWIKEND